ncbi:low temperature requirement protein A [Ornithinimicrobium murale]|uniref:low temperature requirement protein A n=1 Tax=Ornithinimicrobium murale TaxID=1050153 RepID=UPI001EDD8ABE|nr:low temperature requirement protein A [Ornithinimicrobium murale]
MRYAGVVPPRSLGPAHEGRDPDEEHRSATPLELLFDLTLVVAFSQASTQMAHLLELGHIATAVGAFAFSLFAICWAWINYSWLASAYDNDDVFFRVATMVQMLGVLVIALGMPALFHSIDVGEHIDNGIVVAGYVVMRVSTIALWLRAGRHDPPRRPATQTYARLIALAQVVWVIQIFTYPPLPVTVVVTLLLVIFEMSIPAIAERRACTPWHAHHIAERYGLLVIITLGEVILGTILAISAVVEEQGWSLEAVLVASGGVMLAFGLWWVYFTMPSGEVLAGHRERGFTWGYGHLVLFGSLAATGAGLHVAANVIEHEAHLGPVGAILSVVVPVAVFTVALITLYSLLLHQFDTFHTWLVVGALAVLTAAVLTIAAGASIGTGILLAAGAPLLVIVGYEAVGHRHQADAVARTLS